MLCAEPPLDSLNESCFIAGGGGLPLLPLLVAVVGGAFTDISR